MNTRAAAGTRRSTRPKLKKNPDGTVSVLLDTMGNLISADWTWCRAVDFLRTTSLETELSDDHRGYRLRVGNVYMQIEEGS